MFSKIQGYIIQNDYYCNLYIDQVEDKAKETCRNQIEGTENPTEMVK